MCSGVREMLLEKFFENVHELGFQLSRFGESAN